MGMLKGLWIMILLLLRLQKRITASISYSLAGNVANMLAACRPNSQMSALLRRSSRYDKSRAIFVIGLGVSLSTDPIGLDGAR